MNKKKDLVPIHLQTLGIQEAEAAHPIGIKHQQVRLVLFLFFIDVTNGRKRRKSLGLKSAV